MDQHPMGLGKLCRTCGVRSATLGSVCPACGKPYVPGGLLERLPLMGDGTMDPGRSAALFILFLLAIAGGWFWLVVNHFIAGVLVAAALFIALVVAIGLANALTDRGR